jgi:hypothetical protein
MLLDFDEAHTEIWSVDCQHSAENGVLVQVAGSLQCKVLNMAASVHALAKACLICEYLKHPYFDAVFLSVQIGANWCMLPCQWRAAESTYEGCYTEPLARRQGRDHCISAFPVFIPCMQQCSLPSAQLSDLDAEHP